MRGARILLLPVIVAGLLLASGTAISATTTAEVRGEIRKLLEAEHGAPRRNDHGAAAALRTLYAGGAGDPLWSRDARPTPQAQALLAELAGAARYGLEPGDYGAVALAALVPPAGTADASHLAQLDVRLTRAALRFVSDLHYGRVDPVAAGFNLTGTQAPLELVESIGNLARSADVPAALAAIEPPFHHYRLLKSALARYLDLAARVHVPHLPGVPKSVKPGEPYAGAADLRALLVALGDMPAGSMPPPAAATGVLDPELAAGLRAFQARHGLAADGVLGKGTLAALATPLTHRVRQIDLTLERWRWLPPFATPPIIVNIPQFRLFAFRTTEDRVADILQMDVIVGRTFPKQQTPVFEADMKYVVYRPYWDVPYSITQHEMLPKIRANSGYLAAQRLEIVNGQGDTSPVVPPTPANLEALAAGKLRLRQQPGEDNALGLVKFMLPNRYNVYLHSTPAHRLFSETVRAFSHGCIRVSDPVALAEHVMRNAPGEWSRERITAAMNGDSMQRVNLEKPINVLILYGTALATEAGPTLFFADLYGLDKRLEKELGLPPR